MPSLSFVNGSVERIVIIISCKATFYLNLFDVNVSVTSHVSATYRIIWLLGCAADRLLDLLSVPVLLVHDCRG